MAGNYRDFFGLSLPDLISLLCVVVVLPKSVQNAHNIIITLYGLGDIVPVIM